MRVLMVALACLVSPLLWAHEGHDMPGSIPPAPHGGWVKEAASAAGPPLAAGCR